MVLDRSQDHHASMEGIERLRGKQRARWSMEVAKRLGFRI
jgi:hypothetical protein